MKTPKNWGTGTWFGIGGGVAAAGLLYWLNRRRTFHPGNQVEKEIWSLENQWKQALKNRDSEALKNLLSEDFTFITAQGEVLDRDKYIKRLRKMKPEEQYESLGLRNIGMRVFDKSAVVTGRMKAKLSGNGHPNKENMRYTRVYTRTVNGWKLVSGQGTRVE
ncbi:MAG: nuclear transport factor 2 family protein [Candidatus Zixiibacteriota bacterium]|nr:MAG: nuclear transport factor 2 family protein [candidate division Zixibacteria bacterium]